MWSDVRAVRPALPRAAWLTLGAALATAAAWSVFARVPPMHVQVGMAALDRTVPVGYQLSVFPAFGAFVTALALDVARGEERRSWLARAALVGVLGMLAVARLAGALPLSGHALFLFGVLAYEIAPPSDRDSAVSLAAVVPALLVVAWSKLVVWGDPGWFLASAALGSLVGAGLARLARA